MFLFPSRTILFQLQVIIFQEQIFKRFSLGAKERELELICAKNMKISYKICWNKGCFTISPIEF